mmetsp:Transcript_84582/g.167939  ORF Transcript_84582/g.167939 Transcript_84582/m.167939 type:complete len:203 (-) Transcript_84582:1758-2366(-)
MLLLQWRKCHPQARDASRRYHTSPRKAQRSSGARNAKMLPTRRLRMWPCMNRTLPEEAEDKITASGRRKDTKVCPLRLWRVRRTAARIPRSLRRLATSPVCVSFKSWLISVSETPKELALVEQQEPVALDSRQRRYFRTFSRHAATSSTPSRTLLTSLCKLSKALAGSWLFVASNSSSWILPAASSLTTGRSATEGGWRFGC